MGTLKKLFRRLTSNRRDKRLRISENKTHVSDTARFTFPQKIKIGSWVRISKRCYLNGEGGITIGDGTILAPEVVILSSTHRHKQDKYLPYDEYDEFRPVTIGRGVWIGYRAMIVPGVTIGDGAIVAMGAVVTKDVEAGNIVGGNPAKIISQRDPEQIMAMVQADQYDMKAMLQDGLKRIKTSQAPD
jgi:acetyltransferase-like isoleucine patch superfamily enzyme